MYHLTDNKEKILSEYSTKGFVHIKSLLPKNEANKYIDLLENMYPTIREDSCEDYSFGIPDGVRKNKEFWPILWQENIIKIIKILVGEKSKHLPHDDLHYNVCPSGWDDGNPYKISGWHRDTRYRGTKLKYNGKKVWDEKNDKYNICRVAIYLDSYDEHKAPLVFIPFSHSSKHSLDHRFENLFWYRIYANLLSRKLKDKRPFHFPYFKSKPNTFFSFHSKPAVIKPEAGDVMFFDARLIHGIGKRQGPKRRSIFLCYGEENKYFYDHLSYNLIERTHLKYQKKYESELAKELQNRNLLYDLEAYENFNEGPLTGYFNIEPEKHLLDKYKT